MVCSLLPAVCLSWQQCLPLVAVEVVEVVEVVVVPVVVVALVADCWAEFVVDLEP